MIYKFTHHDRVPSDPPECAAMRLHNQLEAGKKLTRQEKDELADILYGLFGAQSHTYKLSGWAFSFGDLIPSFLVCSYDHWQEYHAPDKTSLRKALPFRIERIVEVR